MGIEYEMVNRLIETFTSHLYSNTYLLLKSIT